MRELLQNTSSVSPEQSRDGRASGLLLPANGPKINDVLRAGLPGCIVALFCLSFFLAKPFTIDDTIFMRVAEQAAKTPAQPLAFDMCWDSDGKAKRFSRFIANAPLMGYVLEPALYSRSPEIAGHAIQLAIFALGILATASLALRLGLSRGEATFATLLTATCPVVLGMAGTVMPDVPAMALGVIGVERFLAWRQSGGWWRAGLCCAALTLAPLARPHLALMLPVCALLCLPGIGVAELRSGWRLAVPGFLLLAVSAVLYFGIAAITRDPGGQSVVIHKGLIELTPILMLHRAISIGCCLALTTPLVAGALLLLVRDPFWRWAAILSAPLPLVIYAWTGRVKISVEGVAVLALVALLWVMLRLWEMRSAAAMALALWSLLPVPMIVYLHMAAKYLAPAAPAYAIILVLLARGARPVSALAWRALPVAGLALGIAIVAADARAAGVARTAVERWVPSLESQRHRVLFLGQWGFQWYAEKRGAQCFDPNSAASAHRGDYVMIDRMSDIGRTFPSNLYPTGRLVGVVSEPDAGGLAMNPKGGVGFYDDGFGPLPWAWEPAGSLRFELWKIE